MGNVFKLLPFLKPYWRRAVVALLLLSTLVFLDLSIPRLIQRLIDQGITAGNQQVVIRTALLMLGISALSAVIAIGNNVTSVRVGESFARDLREAQFLKIQSLSYGNLDQLKTGQLIVRLTSDTGALQRLVQVSLRIGTRAPLMMIGSLILMFRTDSRLAFTLLPLLFFTMIVVVFFMVSMEPMFLRVQQRLDRLNTVLQENIAGAQLVKAFARADFEAEVFEGANEELAAQSVHAMRYMAIMSPALTVLVNVGMVLVIWRGGLQAIRGDLTTGQIVAFTNYLLTTMGPLTMMAMLSTVWAYGIASAGRVNQVLEAMPEVLDAPDALDLPTDAAGRITFDHVSFHYNGNNAYDNPSSEYDETVLADINLTVEPGQTVAILGATGAGKSSLINLAPRFYDVDTGRVLIDGIDVRALRQDSLLGAIGIVPQESILFSGTVRENIRYGRPEASDAEVVAAAMAAQAHDFILELPDGYDTRLEERAVNLSGGQKQRIAIARALLLRPKILILDDSTSSVDVETETRIQDALAQTEGSSTKLVVAQRISTVLNADKIVVIDRGRIVAEGTHPELMRGSPIYKEIYDSQLGDGPGQALDAPARARAGGAP